jgi:hypothetical protein
MIDIMLPMSVITSIGIIWMSIEISIICVVWIVFLMTIWMVNLGAMWTIIVICRCIMNTWSSIMGPMSVKGVL